MAASTPVATTTLPDAGAGSGHANFGRLLLAEWTKLRSVRSTYWSLIALVIVALLFSWLIPFLLVHHWDQTDPASRANVVNDPIASIMGAGMYFGQLAVAVLGVMVTTSEYSTGMIRSTLLASPHRTRMLAAKSVVFTVLALVIGEIVSFSSFLIGRQTIASVLSISLSDGTNLRQVVGGGLYLGLLGLFAMVIGSLLRHTAGAITGVVALLLVVSQVIQLIPGKAGEYLYSYEPTNAGYAIIARDLPDKFLLTPWEGYGVFAAWTALLWALAAWILVRRDA